MSVYISARAFYQQPLLQYYSYELQNLEQNSRQKLQAIYCYDTKIYSPTKVSDIVQFWNR